ncbi:SDR family NAD(P)-dependent oxidoreductase [Pseudomonas sp. GM48]|uniref:SDR family NAD(P)-dependent oxidoreductase n=1 Tax=Pseudomonas sp. GM48 TaxID=1144330 RepID=UPI0002704206|nr:SDR family NAD(P)-dependent oxidoreductase [Pseudomonas sp. GM48]EJM55004.1 short-chain dehydrogenase of unknown substrate specificity [Pseudomonas sp. GM48]
MKTFLSIGTGPGIGFATAQRFAREGFRVILSARNLEKTHKLAGLLNAMGYVAQVRAVDASNATNIAELIADVESEHGPLDVLHYNAANIRQATLADQPSDTFSSDLAVNIGGALAAAKAAMPQMITRGNGTILLTGGGFGVAPHPDYLSLSLGKAGIRALSMALFEPSKARGVHVASVTVATFVEPNSAEAVGVAEAFWTLHSQPKESWTAEVTYAG